MLKLVIFDFDGLMVNSEEVTFHALRQLFSEYKHTITWEYYCTHIGIPEQNALKHFYSDYPIPITFNEFVEKKILSFLKQCRKILN